MIRITLPDGACREYDQPLSVFEVAASIGSGLAKAPWPGAWMAGWWTATTCCKAMPG